ncbi:MAG: tyrosine-protein phosphatase [Planctomycetes bacterium]|nr:tyrosine-protein phosphatase [Planctomycetota bacterium]
MAGKLYRSAQLSQPDLDALLAQDRIACVLSLRKDDPPAPEFAAEKDHLRTIGIAHANIPFSPCKLPPPDSVVALIERFDRGPYPMLIHCEDGADRTGFAAVIWLMLYGDKSLAEARASDLSIWTGHFSFGQAHAMNDFFDLYERTAHGQGLREWVTASYPALYDSARRPATRAEVLAHDHN